MDLTDSIQSLTALGFARLEAEIYGFLLQESPATGYRVAQALNKPTANTYKAIRSLEAKGAVMVDDGTTRACRPVPFPELLNRLERTFQRRRKRAEMTLGKLSRNSSDERVYRLRSRDQVLERCRTMLAECRRVALLDVFPEPLEEIRPEVEKTAARGVDVVLKVYAPATVSRAEVVRGPDASRVLGEWPGQQLNLVTDANQHLLALLETGGGSVLQAIWSRSTYLSCLQHSGLASEITVTALRSGMSFGASLDDLCNTLAAQRPVLSPENPGYRSLLSRHGKSVAIPSSQKEK